MRVKLITDETMQSITRSTPAHCYDAHAAEIRTALAVTLAALIVPTDDSSAARTDGRGGGFDGQRGGAQRPSPVGLELAAHVRAFLHNAHAAAQYSPCCEVSATVLLVRVHKSKFGTGAITGANWRAMLLVAIMISQKLVDDISLPNHEFVTLWSILLEQGGVSPMPLTLPELNRMETQLCQLLSWDIGVSSDAFWAAMHGIVGQVAAEISAPVCLSPIPDSDSDARPPSPTTSDALDLTTRHGAAAAGGLPQTGSPFRVGSCLAVEFDAAGVWDWGTVVQIGVAPARRGARRGGGGSNEVEALQAGHVSAEVAFLDGELEWHDFDLRGGRMDVSDGWVPYRIQPSAPSHLYHWGLPGLGAVHNRPVGGAERSLAGHEDLSEMTSCGMMAFGAALGAPATLHGCAVACWA
jgi:hypothetical protein